MEVNWNEVVEGLLALVLTVTIVSAIVFGPMVKRLARVMESRLSKRIEGEGGDAQLYTAALNELKETTERLSADVRALGERQEFLESLLEAPAREALPADGLNADST